MEMNNKLLSTLQHFNSHPMEAVDSMELLLHDVSKEDNELYFQCFVRMGYYYVSIFNYDKAIFYLDRANSSKYDIDDSWYMLKSLLVPLVSKNENDEKNILTRLHENLDSIINSSIRPEITNIDIFGHSFWYAYYDCNPRLIFEKYTQIQMRTYPEISKKILYNKLNINKKPKLGFISCSLVPFIGIQDPKIHSSSISDSFYPTFLQLSKEKYDVYFIQLFVDSIKEINVQGNYIFIPHINTIDDIKKIQEELSKLNFDILMYLEFHMKFRMNYLAFSKLAPIQICTHGHPVTTGIPNDIMDYFISWKSAEIETAQEHYTEKLKLVGDEDIWEYYIPRNTKDKISLITNESWGRYTKDNMNFIPDLYRIKNKNWYFCSQASFKIHNRFDYILKSILIKDSKAFIFLIKNKKELYSIDEELKKRFQNYGIDLNRVCFLEKLKHHELMALYTHSDVILDSWFFGGDTTTRESIETGTPIVTLPHSYLGSRWTQAYYKHLNLEELIVKDRDSYVEKAIHIANDRVYRSELKDIILNSKLKLFYRSNSVKMWESVFDDIIDKDLKNRK